MEHFEPNTALSHPYNDVHLSGNDTKEAEKFEEENVQTKNNNNNNENDMSEHYCVSESSKSSENRNDDEDNDDIHVDEDEFASSPRILSPIQAADKEEEEEELEVEQERESREHEVNTKEGVDLYDVTSKPATPHDQINNNNNINHNNTFTSNAHTKSNEQETNMHHQGQEEEEMENELELQTTPITRKSNDLVWDKSHLLQSLHSDNFVTPTNNDKKMDSNSSNNNKVAFPPCPLTPASKFIAQSMKTPLVHISETHQEEDNTDNNTNKVSACHPYLISPTTITSDNNKFHKGNEECRHTQEDINLVNTRSKQIPNHELENKTSNNNNNYSEEMAHNVRHRQRAKSYSGMTNFLFNNNHTNQNNLSYESMQQMYSSTPRPPRCPSSERSGPHLQRELFTFHVHQPIRESQTNNSSNNNYNKNITPLTESNSSHNANLQDNNHHCYNSPIPVLNSHNSNTKANTCTDNSKSQHVEENLSSSISSNNKVNKEVISPSHVSLNSPMMQMAAVWVDAPVLPASLSNITTNNNNELHSNSIMPSLQSNTLPESNMELGYSSAYRQNKRRTTPRSRSTSQPPSPMTNTLVMMPEQQLFTHCEPNNNSDDNNINSVHEKFNVNTLSVQTEPIHLSQLDVSNDTNKDDNYNSNTESNLHTVPQPEEKHLMTKIAQQQNTIIHELKAMNAGLQSLHCDCGNEKKSEKENSADKTENVHTMQATSNISNNNNNNRLQETHYDHELHGGTVTNDETSKSNKDDKHRNNEALFEPPSYLNTLSSLSSSHAEFQDKVEENETVSSSSSSSSSVPVSPHVVKAPCKTEPKSDIQSTNVETMLHNEKDKGAKVEQKVNNNDKKDNTSQITLDDLMQALERARQRARYIRDKTTKKEEEEEEA